VIRMWEMPSHTVQSTGTPYSSLDRAGQNKIESVHMRVIESGIACLFILRERESLYH